MENENELPTHFDHDLDDEGDYFEQRCARDILTYKVFVLGSVVSGLAWGVAEVFFR